MQRHLAHLILFLSEGSLASWRSVQLRTAHSQAEHQDPRGPRSLQCVCYSCVHCSVCAIGVCTVAVCTVAAQEEAPIHLVTSLENTVPQ